jgi:hypothetical protein
MRERQPSGKRIVQGAPIPPHIPSQSVSGRREGKPPRDQPGGFDLNFSSPQKQRDIASTLPSRRMHVVDRAMIHGYHPHETTCSRGRVILACSRETNRDS